MRDYLRDVKDTGILPGSDALAEKSFQQIYTDVKHMKEKSFIGDVDCSCSTLSGYAPRAKLLAWLNECWKGMGLCLSCVKNVACEEHSTAQ